ncbi:PilZ domain-containing protein [Sphingomonas glaciei]|uniref:PilZ domain-containing protein n=1 Tax=Sphingomonas glaciei TaxID=2938948 RepID=A0ABY5MXG7_9SPHN|nr:PilZ domain-containing protein [Sphingomonas glaciei]UUR08486.1 PilZ domain-containing protein [Sphingomonas glaciei]
MNEFRDRILAGKPLRDPLLRAKAKLPRVEVSTTAEQKALAELAIGREARRQANHRDADRHRLDSETVELSRNGRTQQVSLINLSGGGAMIEGVDGLKLWDRVELRLGGTANLHAVVRWVRGPRFGLEFAQETRIDTGNEELAATLLAVIAKSFPDVASILPETGSAPSDTAETPPGSDGRDQAERELRHPLIWSGIVHFDHDSAPVRLRNISSSGALIESAALYPVGVEVLLDLGQAGTIFATVTWSRGDQAGLLFHSPFDLAELANARPQVATSGWEAPDYLRDKANANSPWEGHWTQTDLGRLQRQLESTRSAIRRR